MLKYANIDQVEEIGFSNDVELGETSYNRFIKTDIIVRSYYSSVVIGFETESGECHILPRLASRADKLIDALDYYIDDSNIIDIDLRLIDDEFRICFVEAYDQGDGEEFSDPQYVSFKHIDDVFKHLSEKFDY